MLLPQITARDERPRPEEYEILELAGAMRIKVLDRMGVAYSKAQLRDLARSTPLLDGQA